jgi:outer membrane protein insertion porin family
MCSLLTDIYADEGYAYADIITAHQPGPENRVVDITFDIRKREQIYMERIVIRGNTRTRDKVIRRELHVPNRASVRGSALKRSMRNLYRLDYFEDIKVDTLRGSADDKMVLALDVTEKPTGTFSFGAGLQFGGERLFHRFHRPAQSVRSRPNPRIRRPDRRAHQLFFPSTSPSLTFSIPNSAPASAPTTNWDYDSYERKSYGGGLLRLSGGRLHPLFTGATASTRAPSKYSTGV